MQALDTLLNDVFRKAFKSAFPEKDLSSAKIGVVATTNPEYGHYQCNAVMGVAKQMKRNPRELATEVVAALGDDAMISSVEVAGPGFINVHLDMEWLVKHLSEMSDDTHDGVPQVGAGQRVILDYSSPNVAKPMHIGHIRSTVIGNALDRLHRACGYDVLADNHVGDWGTQFGKLIMGYRHFLDKEAYEASPVEELERLYVASNDRCNEDAEWLDQARAELVKLQGGDDENVALWREFIAVSMIEFERVYSRLGVRFDMTRGESFYRDHLQAVVDDLKERGLAEESDGATIVDLEEDGLKVCIVQKSDGGFNYATSDLATVARRVEEFNPARVVYVTDDRQQHHFRQFFAIAAKQGFDGELKHVYFGLMRMPEGTISTREGNTIKLEALLDEAEKRSLELIQAHSPDMSPVVQAEVARSMGVGSVKYMDLSQNPQSIVTFSWDKAITLDGNSCPYLQYAHARICSVLDKYADTYPASTLSDWPMQLIDPIEQDLALRIARYPEAVLAATHNYAPNMLAEYLFELAKAYSGFYQNLPFLIAEEGVRESRLRLCEGVVRVLRSGLDLLGIGAPERI